jgi:predicted dithiol-disulfide oxidoreductase (DUF899 family)
MEFPNESVAYRKARNRLLTAEKALRKKVEAVAALRRKLPQGGAVAEDYEFDSLAGPVRLSQLFERGDALVAYSFMYGPQMEKACPMCTSILDGLDGNARHIAQCTNLVVIAKSPLARIQEHARARGWRDLRLLSSARNSYNRDYHGEDAGGRQWPMLNVFVRRGGKLRHFWGSELFYAKPENGMDPRHADLLWPLWGVLDLTPGGRGDFYPKLQY